jgi:flagellar hook-length control protein FliK
MIISSFEGGIKPSTMQQKNGNISQRQSDSTSTFANFDFVLNFIQNLINSSNNLQLPNNKEDNTNLLKSNQSPEPQLFQLVSKSEDAQTEKILNIQNNSDIKNLIDSKLENIDKPQLQSLIKIMNNNEQLQDNILKYIPKEILEYFETNFEKNNQTLPQINLSQIQSQISDISKIKQTDLKIIETTPISKKEFDDTNLSINITNKGNDDNKADLIELVKNKLKDSKVELPTFSDGNIIKEDNKQDGGDINKPEKYNDIFKTNETKSTNTNSNVVLPNISNTNNIKENIKLDWENINKPEKYNGIFKTNETKSTNTNSNVVLPNISNTHNIKENIKLDWENINQKFDNKINHIDKSEQVEVEQVENRDPESKGNFDKVFQDNQRENDNNKENNSLSKGISSTFTLNRTNSTNSRMTDTQTQTFKNVRIEELPELTNKFIQIASKEGTIKANISLYPENLGMLFVQITMKDGGMTITIKAEKSATLDKISSSITNLINNFNDQGLKVENIKLEQNNTATGEEKYTDSKGRNSEQNSEYKKEYLEFLLKTRNSKINN